MEGILRGNFNNIMARERERASELIMVITAMNNELILACRRASELIMAITAANLYLYECTYYLYIMFSICYLRVLCFYLFLLLLLKMHHFFHTPPALTSF